MPQRIRWLPATTPRVAAYQLLYSDAGADAPFDPLTPFIANLQAGGNWDPSELVFFYDDVDAPFRLYRLVTVDPDGVQFETAGQPPFSAGNDPVIAPVPETVPMDHNTGDTDALRYVTPDGVPIGEATVRVYTLANWLARNYAQVVSLVKTDGEGRWTSPIFVAPGTTYVVQFALPNAWGPNTVEVVV